MCVFLCTLMKMVLRHNYFQMQILPTTTHQVFPPYPFLVSPVCVNVVGGTITLTKRSYSKLGIDEGGTVCHAMRHPDDEVYDCRHEISPAATQSTTPTLVAPTTPPAMPHLHKAIARVVSV